MTLTRFTQGHAGMCNCVYAKCMKSNSKTSWPKLDGRLETCQGTRVNLWRRFFFFFLAKLLCSFTWPSCSNVDDRLRPSFAIHAHRIAHQHIAISIQSLNITVLSGWWLIVYKYAQMFINASLYKHYFSVVSRSCVLCVEGLFSFLSVNFSLVSCGRLTDFWSVFERTV